VSHGLSGRIIESMIRLIDHIPDPSVPWITYYDDATGERTELSARTAQNWIDKTSNLLVDELDAENGTRTRVHLDTHWQTLVWILASWQVGVTICSRDADIGLYGPDAQSAGEDTRIALSLKPLGMPFDMPPDGFIDFNAEVRGQPDEFLDLDEPEGTAIDIAGQRVDYDRITDAEPLSRRILLTPDEQSRDITVLRRLLAGGGSLVVAAHCSDERRSQIAATERAELVPATHDPLDSSRSG